MLRRFSADDAWELGTYVRAKLQAQRAPASIVIRRRGGLTMFSSALAGATADTMRWAERKAALVLWFERSSLSVADDLKARNLTLNDFALPTAEFAAAPGGVPIHIAGAGCIAALAVSGLSSSDDHEVAMGAMAWLREQQRSRPEEIGIPFEMNAGE